MLRFVRNLERGIVPSMLLAFGFRDQKQRPSFVSLYICFGVLL